MRRASACWMFQRGKWSDEMLSDKHWNWQADLLPGSCRIVMLLAAKTKAAALPVIGGGGDQAAGAVGTGAVDSRQSSASASVRAASYSPRLAKPEYDKAGSAHTFCHANNGAWHAMGVMLSCGGALRWYRDTFCQGINLRSNKSKKPQSVEPGC